MRAIPIVPAFHTNDTTFYCGPAALACLTGLTGKEARHTVNRLRKAQYPWVELDDEVGGMSDAEMLFALEAVGLGGSYQVYGSHYRFGGVTSRKMNLRQWSKTIDRPGLYLVSLTQHFVVVEDVHEPGAVWTRAFDPDAPAGMPVDKHPARRQYVQRVWRIQRDVQIPQEFIGETVNEKENDSRWRPQ